MINTTTIQNHLRERKAEGENKLSVLFICLGNICRSPAAQTVMEQLVADAGWTDRIAVDSAGIGNWHVGQRADARMRHHAAERGYDITHRARQIDASNDFDAFDLIVTMDDENFRNVSALAPRRSHRALVVPMKVLFERYTDYDAVPDPYYGTSKAFNIALDLIEDGCRTLLDCMTKA